MNNYTTLIITTKLSMMSKICLFFRTIFLAVISSLLINTAVFSTTTSYNPEIGPWSILFYWGTTAKQVFGDVMLGKYSSYGEKLYSGELAYTLDQHNIIRRFFKPVFDVVQVAGNITYRRDYTNHDNVKEGNLYLIWRFSRFPWSNYLKNTIAIGDGVSYNSHVPFADREQGKSANEFSKVLNFLMLEATFALPSHPEFQLVFRIHHHCTAWGSFPKNPNAGSTAVGVGIRYYI